MSSVSFPSSHHGSSSHLADQYYQPSFDTSSFQMNPLSQHPPRTPKTSLHVGASQHFASASMYEDAVENHHQGEAPEPSEAESTEIDGEAERVQVVEKRIRPDEIWREMFVTSNGRDKAFKLIQYTIRLGLWFHMSLTSTRLLRKPSRPAWEQNIVNRLLSVASGLSLTRKLLLLFNWLHPLNQIVAIQAQSDSFSNDVLKEKAKRNIPKPFLHTLLHAPPPVLLEFVNAIADDVSTWSKLGLFGKKFGERAGRFADWCWFFATLVALVENGVERQMNTGLQSEVEGRLYAESMSGATAKSKAKTSVIDEKELSRLRKADHWLQVTRAKLVMDLIFVSYEIFNLRRMKDGVKAVTGLTAAVLSSAKLYDRHKNVLVKAVLTSR